MKRTSAALLNLSLHASLLLSLAAGCGSAQTAPKAAADPSTGASVTAAATEAEPSVASIDRDGAPAEAPVVAGAEMEARSAGMDEPPPPAAAPTAYPPPPPAPKMVTVTDAAPARPAAAGPSPGGGAAPRPAATAARPASPSKTRGVMVGETEGSVAGGVARPAPMMVDTTASVRAGEWDDNANYREFQRWLATESQQPFRPVNTASRQFIVVRDSEGKAVPRCPVSVEDGRGRKIKLTTTASGRAILFPVAEGLSGSNLTATADCQNAKATSRFSLAQSDGVIDLKLAARRALPAVYDVDIAFILDTTGSMSEEIAAVKGTIQKVASSLNGANIRVRMGMVEYKDRTDPFVTKVYPMTRDLGGFSRQVASVVASGGGDTPEDAVAGLNAGLTKLDWGGGALVKLAFLIGDAPPHLDYQDGPDYTADMRDAAHRGIQVFTVAASGMDDLGQVVWRQIAQYTGASSLFVLRGGAGPQSTGGGDPKSSCGGTQTNFRSGNLDGLILQRINREIKAIDRDPMKIPGLRVDENAKPCGERLMIAE
jgi:Mg-chelatase subunit ChlD